MLTHADRDTGRSTTNTAIALPAVVDTLEVTHDGGRLSITVNGVELYYTTFGTRDCVIYVDRK